jgi:hypothetical protein
MKRCMDGSYRLARATTLDTYSRVVPSLHEEAAAVIDRVLGLSVTKP